MKGPWRWTFVDLAGVVAEGGWDRASAPFGGLRISLVPEDATGAATVAAAFVERRYGVAADYSVSSLGRIDEVIDLLRGEHTFIEAQPALGTLGCYVGEVFVRNARAVWEHAGDLGMLPVVSCPVVLELLDGRGCDPVGKVYRRFQMGVTDDLGHFYRVVMEDVVRRVTEERLRRWVEALRRAASAEENDLAPHAGRGGLGSRRAL